jgi:hypothetical protein
MADVVLNHVGYGDLAYGYKPFYKREYFHNCTVLAAGNAGALMPTQPRHHYPPVLSLETRRCKPSVASLLHAQYLCKQAWHHSELAVPSV